MLEMLLYSRPGLIELLPALPKAWAASGRVSGVGARGGFTLDFSWRASRLISVTVHSVAGERTQLTCGTWSRAIALQPGKSVTIEPHYS
jgi:alpha-L-fucosidase 2